MYSATILLGIKQFFPITSGIFGQSKSIVAKVHRPKDISPPPHPKKPVFSKDKDNIYINVPKGYSGAVELIYQLPSSDYVMVGAGYKGAAGGIGRVEFRSVSLHRDLTGSEMTVTDSCSPEYNKVHFDYVILVQEVATGNIGLIDPGVETEVEE